MKLTIFFRLAIFIPILATPLRADEPDPRFRSPRATMRTLYTAIEMAREDPRFIAGAAECLDLSSNPKAAAYGGLLATKLEAVLRAKEVLTSSVRNESDQETYTIPDTPGVTLTMKRLPDGRYLFECDKDAIQAISKAWADSQKVLADRNREAASLNVPLDYASPRATFRSFLTAIHRHDLDTAIRCLDLHDIPAVARTEVGYQMAGKLAQFINRQRLVILQDIPDVNFAGNYVFYSQPTGIVEIARQYAGDRKGEWLFSAATVRSIDNLYDVAEDQPYAADIVHLAGRRVRPDPWHATDLWLRAQLPSWCRSRLFANKSLHIEVYELLGYLMLLVSTVALYFGGVQLLVHLARRGLRMLGVELARKPVAHRLRFFSALLCVLYLRQGLLMLSVDKVLLEVALSVLNPLAWLTGAWALARFIDLIGDIADARLAQSKHRVVATQMLIPVGSLAVKIVLALVTVFHLMQLFSWEVSAVLTGLGIGGLAFALGAQDSLKNLFGSFTLLADRPFVVGEPVKIGDHGEGVVEVVGLRSTRIRTSDDAVLTVPNSDLTTMHITNYGQCRYARFQATVGVVYGTPTERLLKFRNGIRELIEEHPRTLKNRFSVCIDELAESGIRIEVKAFFEAAGKDLDLEDREELILAILRLAESLRIEFAYPTHTVRLEPTAQEAGRRLRAA
jgi:MscS family membrane protein